ncbi:MAG: hypothetical protein ACOZBW_03020 [Thermodesulfobacteriota bacterium]
MSKECFPPRSESLPAIYAYEEIHPRFAETGCVTGAYELAALCLIFRFSPRG